MSGTPLEVFAADIYEELVECGLEPSPDQCSRIAAALMSVGYRHIA